MALEDDFCDIVGKARCGLALTQAELAARCGLGAERIRALEGGVRPTEEEARALAAALGLRPAQLWAIARGAYLPQAPGPLAAGQSVQAHFVSAQSAWAYAVRTADALLLVDCGGEVPALCGLLGRAPDAVLLTHGHTDHIAGCRDLPPGVRVYAHPLLAARLPRAAALADGEAVCGLRVRHSPGHCPDMLTILGPGFAFVGDTLFAGSLGRAQSPSSYPALLASAAEILRLPEDTALFPGHGPATTVAAERAHNAFPCAPMP